MRSYGQRYDSVPRRSFVAVEPEHCQPGGPCPGGATLRGMPVHEGPVGPFPPDVDSDEQRDEYDRLRRRVFWKMPSGLYVIGRLMAPSGATR